MLMIQKRSVTYGILRRKKFCDKIDIVKVSEIRLKLDNLLHNDNAGASQNDIDELISYWSNV